MEDKVNLAAFCREFKAAAAKRGKNYLLTSACLCAVQQDTMQCKAAMQARLRAHAAQQVAPRVAAAVVCSRLRLCLPCAVATGASPNGWKGGQGRQPVACS